MAQTRFSGPVASDNGFLGAVTGNITGNVTGNVSGTLTGSVTGAATVKFTPIAVGSLPAAAAGNAGTLYYVSGTTSGNTMVFSNGSSNIDLVTGVAVVAA